MHVQVELKQRQPHLGFSQGCLNTGLMVFHIVLEVKNFTRVVL